jgi:putative hemolysin
MATQENALLAGRGTVYPPLSSPPLTTQPAARELAGAGRVGAGLGSYSVRPAESPEERSAAFRLRFNVFNLELNEGLAASYETGEDQDEFDRVCDHLIVEDSRTGQVVGSYRLQSGFSAAKNIGYYSEREFDFAPYEPLRGSLLELGRACVDRDHRSFEVLTLLWRGIFQYAQARGLRYLIGCSSLTSQDCGFGSAMYRKLTKYLTTAALQTQPTPPYAFPLESAFRFDCRPPKLLRAYLSIGAEICGPPAIDREFKTIDFLTLLDLERLAPALRQRMLR